MFFVLFRHQSHAALFFYYINSKHANIEFTSEIEKNNKLNSLDMLIYRENNKNFINIQETFTGLGTSFFSFIPFIRKMNAIRTLIHRSYSLSSTFANFDSEMMTLKKNFIGNGFPGRLVDNCIRQFLNKIFCPAQRQTTVPRDIHYVSLPYLRPPSVKQVKYLIIECTSKVLPSG